MATLATFCRDHLTSRLSLILHRISTSTLLRLGRGTGGDPLPARFRYGFHVSTLTPRGSSMAIVSVTAFGRRVFRSLTKTCALTRQRLNGRVVQKLLCCPRLPLKNAGRPSRKCRLNNAPESLTNHSPASLSISKILPPLHASLKRLAFSNLANTFSLVVGPSTIIIYVEVGQDEDQLK